MKSQIARYLTNSNSLRGQLRTFKGVWETSRDLHPTFECYTPGPPAWIDVVTMPESSYKPQR